MAGKTILDRLGITQTDLEQMYYEEGNYRALARRLGVSKTSLQKYLSHIAHGTKPWDSAKDHSYSQNIDYLRRKYRKEIMEHFEQALLTKRTWKDVNGKEYPREALIMTARPPHLISPVMPVYGRLRGTDKILVFLFQPNIPWLSHLPKEYSST